LEVAPAATAQQLELAHTPEYVRRVFAGELTDLEQRRIGFPWSPGMVERARRSVGASIAAAETAVRDGFAANLAGGTHHAFADSGQGYCVFNDVCVAARWLQQRQTVERIGIVDLDVHQGNGTAAIMSGESKIFTLSIHCRENFPYRKASSDLDIELPVGVEDSAYLDALAQALDRAFSAFDPQFAFYVSGADPFVGDRFGKFRLSKLGLARRDAMVYDFFATRQVPVAVSMAGGYARDLNDLVDIHFETVRSGAEAFERTWPGPATHRAVRSATRQTHQ
jgi:acetoin utilization deacetylase AcuC-like enzyme